MLPIWEIRILFLIFSLLTITKSTKLLSGHKKCGDPECETFMSRVLAIKDYIGPDCRYLNFKTGEEIIVYSKLSRKREDLWAGSKGAEFGYFPVDAVRIEETFITKEVELPTKETDFLCIDGGEYVFENEDSILNHYDKENEYIPPYSEEKDTKFEMPEDEVLKLGGISYPNEYKEQFPDSHESDSKYKDLHTLETTSHGDTELRDRETRQDETTPEEDQISQTPQAVPTQSAWTVSGFVGWLGLGSNENEEAVRKISQKTEEVTFRRRKIAITDDSGLKKLNEDGETAPQGSSWFKSTFTDLMHLGSDKSELDLLYKENDPEIHDSSAIAANAGHHGSSAASEGIKEHSNSEQSESSWFDLEFSDILPFRYAEENAGKEKLAAGGEVDQDEEQRPSEESSLIDDGLRKQTGRLMPYEEQDKEKIVQETPEQAAEPTLYEGQVKEKYDQEAPGIHVRKTDSDVQSADEHADVKDAASPSPLLGDKRLKSPYAEQDSIPDNQVMENNKIKAVTKESERTNDQSGMTNNGKLPDDHPKEKHHLNLDKEPNSGQHTEANNVPPVNTEKKIHTSAKNSQHQPNSKRKLSENNLVTHNYTISNEREWLFQIILHLNDFCAIITSVFSVMASTSKKVLAALPENMKPGPDLYGFPWEMVICGAVVAVFTILLLMCRSYQSIRSRLYVGREKQLASKVAELVEDKCKVLEKLSLCKKEYEELENSLKDGSLLQGLASTSSMKAAYEELSSSNSALKSDIECLEKELKEEKSKRSEQDDLLIEIQRRMESLENEAKSIQMQVAEAKSTLKVYEINRERLKISVQDAIAENNQLHESEKQLLKEAEGQSEQLSELNEQAKMLETSKAGMEETLKNKESQVKSLTECLLKMKDWSCTLDEHAAAEDNHWDNDIKTETENGEHLDDQEKRTVKKLIYAAKLNACLKSMESEVNQICSKLTDENKAKEELAERIENLQKEHVTLHSENTHFESEVQKLQQKLKVMTELYQENEMNLHRKLTVEEKDRLQKEEKLSKVDETISHAAEEVNRYRQRAEELEEELKKTVHSYENLVKSHEQKAHDNWLAARAAERHLSDIREENAYNRQKLTEAEFKFDRLEKDPYALDMPVRAFGREHSPYGPSPMGRPSSETRAFLSPPTLLEGPLRFSPVLPGGGGGRGSRGPGNAGMYEVSNERGELHSDRLSDPHRPPSDTGSLSPPWDRDHRIMPPPAGQLYNEQSLPRRPERFYPSHPNSGRLSGPAELRSYSMPSYDKADGQASENNSGTDLSGNGIRDHPNDSNTLNASDQSHAPDNGGFGPGIVPPQLPLLRAPLMPMDPRGPFMRRGPPFPPVPPSGYGPREYFPRDFAGLPRPLLPMRGPFPVRPYSQYPPPRAGFFPPLPPESRNEMPAELAHPSTASSATPQESQQET
ncbi:melanoma inhibitory activity protein 2 isoform X7 [Podarcis raffonei]|uniref:melanoma inhibitory activity protein 2 isoform X7 n=1 Tax=Podarcis raffonei TaxID=65483 RepID=UPI0023293426|nr:melanoma inhibitory activity protein 2 isoform X7 [Podarcis raffonei]